MDSYRSSQDDAHDHDAKKLLHTAWAPHVGGSDSIEAALLAAAPNINYPPPQASRPRPSNPPPSMITSNSASFPENTAHHSPPLMKKKKKESNVGSCSHRPVGEDKLAFARACISNLGLTVGNLNDEAHRRLARKKSPPSVAMESNRRKQITRNFHTLRDLLPASNAPNCTSQIDRCSIVDRTCAYIHSLETQLYFLQRKARIMKSRQSMKDYKTNISIEKLSNDDQKFEAPHVELTLTKHNTININIGYYKTSQIHFSNILYILEHMGLEVASATFSQSQETILYAIFAKAQQLDFPIEELRSELCLMASLKL